MGVAGAYRGASALSPQKVVDDVMSQLGCLEDRIYDLSQEVRFAQSQEEYTYWTTSVPCISASPVVGLIGRVPAGHIGFLERWCLQSANAGMGIVNFIPRFYLGSPLPLNNPLNPQLWGWQYDNVPATGKTTWTNEDNANIYLPEGRELYLHVVPDDDLNVNVTCQVKIVPTEAERRARFTGSVVDSQQRLPVLDDEIPERHQPGPKRTRGGGRHGM